MKLTTALSSVALIALLGGGMYYFLRAEPLPASQAPAASSPAQVAMTFADNKITEQADGKVVWELTAEAMAVDSVTQNVSMHKVQGTFYSDKGTTMTISSQEGSLDSKSRNVLLTGDVHAVASDGGDFTAPAALWQGQTKLFLGTGGVRVVKDTAVLTGDQLEGDSVLNKIKVSGHAHIVTKEAGSDGL